MLLVAVFQALLDAAVVWAVVNHENQVYSGCGFDVVQGQPSMFKFCNALGHCIKTSCGSDRVFSKIDCGCVPSLRTGAIDDIRLPQLGRTENVTAFKAKAHVVTSVVSAFVDAAGRMVGAVSSSTPRGGLPKTTPEISTLPSSTDPVPMADLPHGDLLIDRTVQSNPSFHGPEKSALESGVINSPVSKATNVSDSNVDHSTPSSVSVETSTRPQSTTARSNPSLQGPKRSALESGVINSPVSMATNVSDSNVDPSTPSSVETSTRPQSTTARSDVQRNESSTTSFTTNATRAVTTNTTFVCRTEVNISGMNDQELLTGESSVGTVYIGVRGLTNRNGAILFNGSGLLWIPYFDNVDFPSGLTISIEIHENISRQVAQGLVSNCGDGVLPSFSIVLDPVSRSVRFKAVVLSTHRSTSSEETLEVSVPYESGIKKAIEMECDGHNLIGRVNGHVAGKRISAREKYVVSSRPKPIYVGKGCREEETHDFYGEVKKVLIHRCTRTLASP